MFRAIRKIFAILIAAPLFIFLAWFFGVFLQPQGALGAGFALALILASAIAAVMVFAWLAKPGPLLRFRNRGVEGIDKDWGMGLVGASQATNRRRREDDFDDVGGRRSSDDIDADGGEEQII